MSGASLRWGLLLGAVAAALGIGAQAVGFATLPHAAGSAVDGVVGAVLIAGALGLLALVVALGLAYFAGIRVERAHPRGSLSAEATLLDPGLVNRGPALAGLLVMALYWIGTTAYGVVGDSPNGGGATSSFLTTHALLGLVFLAFGFGLGALGGRSPAARSLLDEITKGSPITDTLDPTPGPSLAPSVSADPASGEIAPSPSAVETSDDPV